MDDDPFPARLRTIAGALPEPGRLDAGSGRPFETIEPAHEGFVERDGVRLWYAVWGKAGPWLAFAPPFQVVHSALLKGCVPYLSQHFRVVTTDGRGNGRSDRPQGQPQYRFDLYFDDFVAVLDAAGAAPVSTASTSCSRTARRPP